jgi:amino acid transporter
VGVSGVPAVEGDPAVALATLAPAGPGWTGPVVVGLLVPALLLCLNTVTIGSSRTLYQMARNGSAWRFLGQLNRHGVPGNALRFDLAVNVGLLLVVVLLTRGRPAAIPIALLAAANVGYFVAVSLALLAAWTRFRAVPRGHGAHRRVRPAVMRAGAALAVLNLALLAAAGFAWGWLPVGTGVVILTGVVALSTRHRGTRASPLTTGPPLRCMAWGSGLRTATTAELDALYRTSTAPGEVAQP